jgi:hypothetical protein
MKFLFDGEKALRSDLTAVFGTPQEFNGTIDDVCVLDDAPNTTGLCKCYKKY